MTPAPRFDLDELMRHDAFVRKLARRLVRDAQTAEDVAQQTWVAAIEATVHPLHSIRAWLGTIVQRTVNKRAGADRTRRQREAAVAPSALTPSAADILEREQAHAAVVRALLTLPENYRDVVVLRWFEDLPPRDIAKRLGVPVETVRTRHRRAIEQLRRELDRRTGGDRSAWAAMLWPLVRRIAPPLPATTAIATTKILGATLLMSSKLKLSAAAIAVAIAFTAWMIWPPTTPPPRTGGSKSDVSTVMAATVPTDGDGGGNAIADRVAANTTSGVERELAVAVPTTGAVHVRVTWADDGSPAANVTVTVSGRDVHELLATDAHGMVRLTELSPESYYTNIIRPSLMWFEPALQQPHFEVVAGVTTEIDLVVSDSLDITGIVVDGNDRPIPDAEIVFAGGYSVLVLAKTDDDGRFFVRDVATRCEVGARAPGYAPSPLRNVQGSVGGSVELRLVLDQPGVRVAGVVLGPDEQPIALARVFIGKLRRLPIQLTDGTWGIPPPRSVQVTDNQGRFSMTSVTPGTVAIEVNAVRYVRHHGELVLTPGSNHSITVHMVPGVTVHGVVRNARGLPVAKASVSINSGTARSQGARTSTDGSYKIVDVALGELTIEVEGDAFETQRATLTATAGQTLRWDPTVLSSGIPMRGRVLDANDLPVADVSVSASRSVLDRGMWSRRTQTLADGSFELPNCKPGVPLYVDARHGQLSEARLKAVLPEGGELVIRLPPTSAVRMRGIVLDDRGKPLPNVAVWASNRHGARRTTNDIETGAFVLGPFVSGEYTVWIRADGFAPFQTEYRTLANNETWDLGELRMQRGGTLRVALLGNHSAFSDRYLRIRRTDGSRADGCQTADGIGMAGPFATGDYHLQIEGTDVVAEVVPFQIREGIETRLDVPLRRGTPVKLHFEPRPGGATPVALQLTLSTVDGAAILQCEVWHRGGQDLAVETMLLPGKYRIEATTEADEVPPREGSIMLEVGSEPVTQRVELASRD